jgi:aarF domain-containing kinase
VLIDHGLYIQSSEEFRKQYCRFWVGMFTFDSEALDSVARAWGIPDIGLFATATLAKPWRRDQQAPTHLKSQTRLMDAFEMHQKGKERLVEFLRSMDRMPDELMFIGRNMNIVRANNKALGMFDFLFLFLFFFLFSFYFLFAPYFFLFCIFYLVLFYFYL